MKVLLDDQIVEENCAMLPISRAGFLLGDGVFTTLKVKDGCVEGYFLHKKRFQNHQSSMNLKLFPINDRMIQELIIQNDALVGSWRLKMIIIPYGRNGDSSKSAMHTRFIAILSPYEENTSREIRLGVYPYAVVIPSAKMKSISYAPRFILKEYANEKGWDDVIVCNEQELILETVSSNIFWRKGNVLYTPDASLPLLKGVMLSLIIEVCRQELGYDFHFVHQTAKDIDPRAQVFITNSLKRFKPVTRIENRVFNRDLLFETILANVLDKAIIKNSLFCHLLPR